MLPRRLPSHPLLVGALFLAVAACGGGGDPDQPSVVEQAVWSNGDFESDPIGTTPPTGWTLTSNLHPGITDTRPSPQTFSSLNLAAGGTLMTAVVGGAPESQLDLDLLTNGVLRFPKYGQRATRVNSNAANAGTSRNVNTLKQTMTVSLGDVDPVDNKVHVRFAVAPVLENPGHSYTSQPYYFVRLQNLTKGLTVYQDFNASGQPGVPWQNFTDTSGQAAQFTNWQLVDVSPGDTQLAVGDQVELMVIAAGCSAGGHWGHVYVDAVGSGVPGLYSWATGPQLANAGSTITYTLNYKNGGTTTTNGTRLDFVTPPDTTFQSVSLGAACTTPAVGATGTVSCPIGTLANGSTGSFQVTVNIPPATPNGTVILNGNYSIYATGISALIGPKVFTTVTNSVSYADLGVTISDGVAAIAWGQPTTYTIDVTNDGPVAAPVATVTDTMPAQLTGVTWTCAASGGGTCTASGSGNINDAVSLPVGAHLVYTVSAAIIAGSGSGQVINTVTVATGGGVTDPDTTNNTALDTDAIGTLRTLTLTKLGTVSGGLVSSVPTSISCGTGCASDSGQFLDGSQVVLTAAPVVGATFTGWGGACSGTATSCTVTMTGDQSVTASFTGAPAAISVVGGGAQSTTINTAFASPLQVLVTDAGGIPVPGAAVAFAAPGSGASATLSATTATTNAAGLASVTATANGTAGTYSVTATVSGVPPASFSLSNVGIPTSISVVSGSGQSATVNTAFAAQLVAVVRDAASQPVPGITVTFTPPASGAGATLSAATAVTNASGQVSLNATANTVAGSYAVTASVVGVVTPASFALTNTAGAPATLTLLGATTRSATVDASLGTFTAQVTDAFGNPVSGVTLTFSAPGSGATALLSSGTSVTNASGQASITATAGAVAGSYALIVSGTGLASQSFALTNTAGAPASLAIVSGDNQQATVDGAFAPLVVVVRDGHGNPVPGATVSYAAPGAGATAVVTPSAITDAAGQASAAATAGAIAGAFAVTASVTGVTPVSFALENLAGAPAAISIASGSPQTTAVTTAFSAPLVIRVVDVHGNAVPGAAVTFTPPGSGASASLSATTVSTDASGLAQSDATANTVAGSYAVTASVAGVATPASFALTNTAGPATTLTLLAPTSRTSVVTGSLGTLTAQLRDAFGNPVPGATVSFSAPASGATATLSAGSATTNASGQASITATAGTIAGAFAITVSATGTVSQTFLITTTPGAPASLSIVSGDPQSAVVDAAFAPLVVAVHDAHGNVVPGATVTFTAPGAGATASVDGSADTDGLGVATAAATAGTVAGSYTVVASLGALAPVSFTLQNLPGAPASLALVGGGDQSAVVTTPFGSPIAVRVLDAHGNPVPGATVTFTPPGAGASATLSASVVTSDASGVAQISATANTVAGAYAVGVAVAGVATPVSVALTNTPGAPASISVTSGGAQSTVIETAFPLPLGVIVQDAHGNPVPGATVSFSAPASGATAALSTSTLTTDGGGLAQSSATANSISGSYLITAAVAGVVTSAQFSLRNTAGVAATIDIVSGGAQETVVATPFPQPLVVLLRDASGNPVPGVSVRFAAPPSSPSAALSAEVALSDDAGLATITATADPRAGSYDVTAELRPGVTATFFLRNLPGAPAQLRVGAASSPQSATVLTDFVETLLVRVEDAFGNPVPGVTVSYQAPGAGATATLTSSTAVSDTFGECEVGATAGAVTGLYLVTATVSGVADAAVFALTNLAGAPTSVVAEAGAAQATEVDTDFAEPLTVRVLDALGNPVPSAVVSFAAAATPATAALSASSVATDGEGLASVIAHASTVTGSHVATAVVDGAATPVIFSLTNTPGAPDSVTVGAVASPQQAEVTTAYPHDLLVRVADRFGNAIPGVEVTYAAPDSGATGVLSSTTSTSDDAGLASVGIVAGTQAGPFTVTASVAGVLLSAQFQLTNLAGAAHTLSLVSGDGQVTTVDTAFAELLLVRVTDIFGNPVADEQVTFTAEGSSATASLGTLSVATDAQGLASTSATANTVSGSYLVRATSAQGATPVAFTLRNAADVPATIIVAPAATPQSAEVLHAYTAPLEVTVLDRFGNPVPGAVVTYTSATGPGASLSAAQVTTDGTGAAQVLAIADEVAGAYQVQATVDGVATPATFELTNTASAPGRVVVARGDGQSAMALVAYAEPLVFLVLDGFGNPVPGVSLSVTMPSDGPRAALTTQVIGSDAAGEVGLQLQAADELGTFQISATAPGVAVAATASLSVTPIPTEVTASAPKSVAVDQPAQVTIEVSAPVGTPAGELEIVVDGGAAVVSATLKGGRVVAPVPLSVTGAHTLAVRYPAQGPFEASETAAFTIDATGDSGTLSGSGGCDSGGGGSLALGLLVLAFAGARRRRAGAAASALALALVAWAGSPARAQEDTTRSINRFHAASAESDWFALDSLAFDGALDVAFAQTWDYAHRPLVVYDADGTARAAVIRNAFVAHTGASVTLRERFRLSTSVPMAVFQNGDDGTFNGEPLAGPKFAFGDMLLAGDVRVLGAAGAPLRAAVGLRVSLPTGSRTHYMSDSKFALEPRGMIAGSRGALEYAAELSLALRSETSFAGEPFGSELRYGASCGARLLERRLLIGPELSGALPLTSGSATGHPTELGVGAHYAVAPDVLLGAGLSAGLVNAVGTPDQRLFLSVSWSPTAVAARRRASTDAIDAVARR
ncbi:MAG: Ig-like domain-containing protein [Kofleriaceae bacterium]